ncbi:MAG TPA: queuosine salvage family protein [Acidimicrobiales bacterium]|nr:queuosine salvage family protein [Acidimicrobiales bacterium]
MLEEVRSTCAAVATQASRVRIETDALNDYGPALLAAPRVPDDDPGRMRLATVEDTVAFVVALDAINFGSGWFPVLHKRAGMSGYHTVASIFREHGAPTAAWLAEVTTGDCVALFDQDPNGEAVELMAHFAEAWNQLGRLLLDRYDGSAVALVEDASHSADRLVELLRAAPYFEDRRSYRGIDVAFYKRAQIVAADLDLALDGKGPGRFDDLDRLTIFADNLVPHVLRVDGVLVLDPALAAHIDDGRLLQEGSEEEVELRACAVHAVELLAAATGATPAALDNVLWNRGQGAAYKAIPRPRCRTVSY